MPDSHLYSVTGVVLRSREFGEGHRLFTFYTREEGKLLAVARGVQKPRAKLAAALQQFSLGEITLAKGRRFDVVTQMRVLNPFYALRGRLEALVYASYFAELYDESLEERQQHPSLYTLLVEALTYLAAGSTPEMLGRYVEINLIAVLGYLPQLTHCAQCQAPLATANDQGHLCWPTWLGFSPQLGGALCPGCLPLVPGAKRIAAGTVQIAQLLLTKGFAAVESVKLSDRLRREIETTFRDYLEYRLERRMQSARFLHEWGDDRKDEG